MRRSRDAGDWNTPPESVDNGDAEALVSQPGDILTRRLTIEAAVLPTELRGTQVADALTGVRRVQALKQHQPARLMEPENLLILQRTHGRHGFEALMKGGRSHVDGRRHLLASSDRRSPTRGSARN